MLEYFNTCEITFQIDMQVAAEEKLKSSSLKLVKGKKGKSSKISEKSLSGMSFSEGINNDVPPIMNKKHQTPRIYPCEEVKMSHAATLGEIAQNSLNLGEPLTGMNLHNYFTKFIISSGQKLYQKITSNNSKTKFDVY